MRVAVGSGIVTRTGTTLEATDVERLNELVGRDEGVVAIQNEVVGTRDVVARLNPAVNRFMARLDQMIAILPLFLPWRLSPLH